MIPRIPKPLVIILVVIVLTGVAYIVGRRSIAPAQPVDREIVKIVERLIPGEVRTVFRDVPGPTRTEVVRVPVEVTRIVREVGPERIVTVTRPVDVPIEVIRETWPQTIVVRVGGVRSGGQWFVPDNQDLVVGQVTQGVYAVSSFAEGWRIEKVTTTTRVDAPLPTFSPLPYHIGVTVGILGAQTYAGIVYQNRIGPAIYQVTVGYGFPGPLYGVSFVMPLR